MWRALAEYAVRGPAQAALASFSTLLLSLFAPPLVVVSNAVVALVWLRLGPVKGLTAVAIALFAGTIIAAFSGKGPPAGTRGMKGDHRFNVAPTRV